MARLKRLRVTVDTFRFPADEVEQAVHSFDLIHFRSLAVRFFYCLHVLQLVSGCFLEQGAGRLLRLN